MRDRLLLLLLLTACFTLATEIEPRLSAYARDTRSGGDFLTAFLGESGRLFANHFAAKADAYYHRGNYPSIFELGARRTPHPGEEGTNIPPELPATNAPSTWIERFGDHFTPPPPKDFGTTNDSEETLPWYRLSLELDPHNIQNYCTAVFVLRNKLGKTGEAERVLRDGIRENPNSYELLYYLGLLYYEDHHDVARARNVWELAAYRWREQELKKPNPDIESLWQIADQLGNLEESQHNYSDAITWFQIARNVSRTPQALQQHINELKAESKANGK